MPVLLRATGAGSRQIGPIRPTSQASNDTLRVPTATSRRVSQQSVSASLVTGNTVIPGVRRTASAATPGAQTWREWFRLAYRRYYLKNLIPLLVIMFYMLIGSLIFYWLEGSHDSNVKEAAYRHYKKEREFFYRRVEEIVQDKALATRVSRKKAVLDAITYFEENIGFSISPKSPWDLMTAMYYSGTLFTTIGYGDVSCVTTAGRILTVIYSCIGIPLMLITLNDLGKFLYNNINGCVKKIDNVYLGVIRMCKKPCQATAPDEVDMVERGDGGPAGDVSSVASEIGSEHNEDELEDEELGRQPPRMSVKVALGITIGWIFFCSFLFRLWEDWTYGESLYFMYISLSTIGLGDISVARRDMMVLCFVFVIVGLSLVSMCINVVQVALEDFYINMMMKLIMEYQEKLAAGGDRMGASVGMMKMWGNNRTAKLLMPLLSKEKKKMAMEKVEVEAKSQGLDVPTILTDLDDKTGMPKLLCIEEDSDENNVSLELEAMVQKQILDEEAAVLPIYIAHDSETQTDSITCVEKMEQTVEIQATDECMQTESEERLERGEVETQTDSFQASTSNAEIQTAKIDLCDADTITAAQQTDDECIQTDERQIMDQEVQTHIAEQNDAQTITEIETKNIRIQTPCPVIEQKTIQTEDLEERKSPSKMSEAKKRFRRAFAKPSKQRSLEPAMSDWKEVDEEENSNAEEVEDEGSVESLHWDPVDGMHAEKQLPVSRLKDMFDKNFQDSKKRFE
ncbi:unnamed protein product [Auanema sp. JU1783]|nr:unnamed protein product [Auanema sp. JU1783]